MSEPVVKQRPTIDLDDFERRLRQQPARADDPLAELARLVGEPYDPFNDVFEREAAARQGQGAPQQSAAQQPAPQQPMSRDPSYGRHDGRREPAFGAPQPGAQARPFGDFAAIEAGLRGTYPGGAPEAHAPQYDQQHFDQGYGQGYAPDGQAHHGQEQAAYGQEAADAHYGQDWAAHEPTPPRASSRRPMALMAATIAVGVVGIGAAFALKGRISSSPREVKTIMAEAGPTKIQPPPDTDASGTDGATSGRGQTPTSLVNREEQPVDIAQAMQDNAARVARMNPGAMPTRVTDASSVPVPPSPRQVQTAMADPKGVGRDDVLGDQIQSFGLSDMPAPKRVKVVSVRPDGTILPNDQPPTAAIPAPRQAQAKTSDHAGPVAKASTPKVVAAKSTTRVATTPKTIEQLATDEAPADAKPAKKAKPQRLASADPGEPETQAATPAAGGSGGGFAVQLAAPGTEAEAKATSSRLAKKYADALGDNQLGFHKAESNGKPVYRVRVGSLSRADAVSLCEKLKADGGSCFVAKN